VLPVQAAAAVPAAAAARAVKVYAANNLTSLSATKDSAVAMVRVVTTAASTSAMSIST
jgi:hypothetical protein